MRIILRKGLQTFFDYANHSNTTKTTHSGIYFPIHIPNHESRIRDEQEEQLRVEWRFVRIYDKARGEIGRWNCLAQHLLAILQ